MSYIGTSFLIDNNEKKKTNDAYVMIPIVARVWESWLSATFHLMSIACLVAEIFNYHSKISSIATVMLLTVTGMGWGS